jgi:hypothetical protein
MWLLLFIALTIYEGIQVLRHLSGKREKALKWHIVPLIIGVIGIVVYA